MDFRGFAEFPGFSRIRGFSREFADFHGNIRIFPLKNNAKIILIRVDTGLFVIKK